MNLSDQKIDLCFDCDKIIIAPHLSFDDFIKNKKGAGHNLLLLEFYNGDILCTKICSDYTERNLAVENHTENFVKTAFGNNQAPSWQDFENFLEERCVPRNRDGLQYYLDAIGVDEYDPLKIIAVTKGRKAEDDRWIEIVDL